MEYENLQVAKKRTLKKVRRDFLNKRCDEDEPKEVDSSTRLLNSNNIHLIAGNIGLVEINRQIYLEPGYVNMLYAVQDVRIDQRPGNSIIRMNFQVSNKNNLMPWEYTVKRLESYGDLNLATWAYKIKNYYAKHMTAMANYYDIMNMKSTSQLIEMKEASEKLYQEIESERSFFMARYLAKIDSIELVSASYDEGFLKELGFDIQNFSSWTLSNGLPKMLEQDCSIGMKFAQLFLNSKMTDYKSIQKEPQHLNSLVDRNGGKKLRGLQTILVTEYAEEGIYLSAYCTLLKEQEFDLSLKSLVPEKSNSKIYKPASSNRNSNLYEETRSEAWEEH